MDTSSHAEVGAQLRHVSMYTKPSGDFGPSSDHIWNARTRSSISFWTKRLRLMDNILQVLTDNILMREMSSKESRLEMLPPYPPDINVGTVARGRSELARFCPFGGGVQRLHAGPNIKFGGQEGARTIGSCPPGAGRKNLQDFVHQPLL